MCGVLWWFLREIEVMQRWARLQLQRSPIHSSPANLIITIHYTMAFRKLWNKTGTKYKAYKITLARVVTNTSKFKHITPILKKLHWLPIKQRIDYKLCLLTYKTLHIQQPTSVQLFLSFSLSVYNIIWFIGSVHPIISEHLWVKGPFLSLLQDSGTPSHQTPVGRNSLSLSTVRSKLKTHLFKLASPPPPL